MGRRRRRLWSVSRRNRGTRGWAGPCGRWQPCLPWWWEWWWASSSISCPTPALCRLTWRAMPLPRYRHRFLLIPGLPSGLPSWLAWPSGSYVTVCGLACGPSAFPYFSRFFGPGDFAQLTSSLGIAAGSYLSAYLSGVTVQFDDPEASAARSFVGGFLVLFGARLAGGCASGHGLSGIARLSVGSL